MSNLEKQRHKILIVDDSPLNLRMLSDLLASEWDIITATNAKDALVMASSELPDLIILDVVMPEINGYTACRLLKDAVETRDIPVIFVTAMNQTENESLGLKLGAIDYISKPYSEEIVQARVRNHLELKQYRDVLKNASMIDGLTGIPNRRRLDEVYQSEWKRAVREKKNLTVMMIDIDYFKRYNDHYGHQAGDECLRKVANILKDTLRRPGDFVGRYGGEEFMCILPNTPVQGAKVAAEHIQKNIMDARIPHSDSDVAKRVTISIGIAILDPEISLSSEALLECADKALYKAKRTGRNKAMIIQLRKNSEESLAQ